MIELTDNFKLFRAELIQECNRDTHDTFVIARNCVRMRNVYCIIVTPLSRKIRDKLSRTSIRANKDRGK